MAHSHLRRLEASIPSCSASVRRSMPAASFPARIRRRCGSRTRRKWKSRRGWWRSWRLSRSGFRREAGRPSSVSRCRSPSHPICLHWRLEIWPSVNWGRVQAIYAEPETVEAAAWEFAENETKIDRGGKAARSISMGTLRSAGVAAFLPLWRDGKSTSHLPDADCHPGHPRPYHP